MRDVRGDVLYIGKATSLRARVRSYFGSSREPGAEGLRAASAGARPRARADAHRGGGAAPRGDAREAAPAAVQRAPQGRQALSVPEGGRAEPVAPRDYHASRRGRRGAVLRAVRLGGLGAQGARRGEEALPVALLHEDDHRHRRPPLPRLLHQALHRAVHLVLHPRGVRGGHPPDGPLPRGALHRGAAARRVADARARPRRSSSNARPGCATRRRPSAR